MKERLFVLAILLLSLSPSCGGGGGRCSEEEIDPYRRFECVPISKGEMCDIHNNPAEPLTDEQYKFLACCQCGKSGNPSCDECD